MESVHQGMYFSDNSKHFSNICSLSIFQKNLLGSNYFFVSGAARLGALSRRHKGGRPADRRLKIVSMCSGAAGAALRRPPSRKREVWYVVRSMTVTKGKIMFGHHMHLQHQRLYNAQKRSNLRPFSALSDLCSRRSLKPQ